MTDEVALNSIFTGLNSMIDLYRLVVESFVARNIDDVSNFSQSCPVK